MSLSASFLKNWKRICPQQTSPVLLAVSGGVDSMAMAHLFHEAKIPFAIAHCNFHLRAADSDKDQQLVRETALAFNVPFHTVGFDTKAKMLEWKKAVQETARILRYEWLDETRRQEGYSMIATAHHANDNAETLLMNLFKGTGMSGLHAIPVINGSIVRPLLFAMKEELLQYAAEKKIVYREDASNDTDAYKRNIIRHHIVTEIEKYFPGATERISESIARFVQGEELYHRAVAEEIKGLAEQRGHDMYIPIRKLVKSKQLETICYELFSGYGFSSSQIPQIISLMDAISGHFITSRTHRIIRHRDFLILTLNAETETDIVVVEGFPSVVHTAQGSFHFVEKEGNAEISSDKHLACADLKKLSFPLILRRWKQGDYFYPLGMGMKKKKVARYFIDQKIPLHEKEKAWVLESDGRIVWVAGYRSDERFKIKDVTKRMLEIRFEPLT